VLPCEYQIIKIIMLVMFCNCIESHQLLMIVFPFMFYSQGGKVPASSVSGQHKSDANVDGDSELVGKFTVWFNDFTRFDQQLHLLIDLNVFTDSDEQLLLLLKVRYILDVMVIVVAIVVVASIM